MGEMERTDHRVTVWARGKRGVPVSCTCGWRAHASTVMGAYALKRKHAPTDQGGQL
jgi:hypothetical protein